MGSCCSVYEMQSGDVFGDSLSVAVVSRQSHLVLRSALRTHVTTIGTGYRRLRTFVSDVVTWEHASSGTMSGATSTPMKNVPVERGRHPLLAKARETKAKAGKGRATRGDDSRVQKETKVPSRTSKAIVRLVWCLGHTRVHCPQQ